MGKLYSLERRRRGQDPAIPEAVESMVIISDKLVGSYTPDQADALARAIMMAAARARQRRAGACRACHRLGCTAFHPGQVRRRNRAEYVVIRQTKNAWRLEPVGGGKPVYTTSSMNWTFVRWEKP